MDLNATLIGQMISFLFFIVITMKYIWPHFITLLEQRRKTVADGLAQAEKAQRDAELMRIKTAEELEQAKLKVKRIIEGANQQSGVMIEEARKKAREEAERLITLAQADIEQQRFAARKELIDEVSTLVIAGAEKVLGSHLDGHSHVELIDNMIKEI